MQARWCTTSIFALFLIKCGLALKNSVLGITSVCNQEKVNVTIEFENDFNGVLHSRGADCPLSKGLPNKPYGRIISFSLDPTACSLRIYKENGVLWYSGTLVLQMSETVQQATDPLVQVKCSIGTDMLMMKTKLKRTGRKMSSTERNETGKAWLEVRGSAISTFNSNSLSVGEHTTLSVYTSLPEGISGLPVECRVDDGHGGTQSLTDDRGCPTDPALVPRLRQAAPGHWATAFPAFSFPDTHIVHYTCLLMLCSGACPKFDCNEEGNSTRNSRDFQEESILDFVELYNSVEVNAPNIELGYLRKDAATENQGLPSGITEDGWVCLSGPRVALVFATLGALFLAAVLATLLLLIRHRRKHHYRHQHHYGIYT
ncbi:cypher [Rhodnius prolixus]|uniref:ZP domain-containing protein n=1 Tax=Rhodnius prolixus TaxID=13249 RepID=T1HHW0_RHOPR